MSKKELIEDSQEVREAMAELKAKAESEAAEETADTTSTEEDSYNDYAEDESSYAEDYTEESQTEESAPSEIEEEETSAEKSDAGAIARTREETRRLRKAQFSENRQAASRDKEEGVREKRPAEISRPVPQDACLGKRQPGRHDPQRQLLQLQHEELAADRDGSEKRRAGELRQLLVLPVRPGSVKKQRRPGKARQADPRPFPGSGHFPLFSANMPWGFLEKASSARYIIILMLFFMF